MQAPKLRPYQEDAVNGILQSWRDFPSSMTVVATGGGKTIIAAAVAQRVISKGRFLFLANRNELCLQPLGAFRSLLGFVPALEKAESKAPLDAQVVVASIQTLSRQKRLERFAPDHFSFIFADEAHMAAAASWERVLTYFSGAKVAGLTATPFRSDNKDLTKIFQTEAYRKDLFSLVDDGYLVSPDHVDRLSTPISLEQVRIKRNAAGEMDYDLQDAANAIEPWFEAIALELAKKHASRRILAFLPLVASSEKFVAACCQAGIKAAHVDGNDPLREEKLERFRTGEITLLSNSNLLHTGIDIPPIDSTLNLRPTKSKVLYQQIVGRSTRTLPGIIDGIETVQGRLAAIAASKKPAAYIIDPLWLTSEHDLVTPAYLIAQNQEEAEDMNKAAGSSYGLRSLHRDVQREREEAIRRRLAATARFREGRVNAQFYAASSEDHALVNYTPVYPWEHQPIKNMDRNILIQAGIDPDSISCQGHARAVIKSIYKRRGRGLAEIVRLAPVAESRGISLELWNITSKELSKSYANQ